ncbi:hypothetical protein WJX72_006988 [[Myrmecia] bisecta]|uniref:Vacuolar protein 14 C-terminal Fig4-binding domain-containing protein n=1 Tax=[Myrmecia] bisecta TaxID=41462 RepID=A0AAW1PQP6_9CHLO
MSGSFILHSPKQAEKFDAPQCQRTVTASSSTGGKFNLSVVRSIGDKLYEKRKTAALEVEQVVKLLASQGNTKRVGAIIDKLVEDFAFSSQANYRKGGLLCLAATAVGLADHNAEFLPRIVPPVINSFTDQDSRVRYYACEALYNIAKVAREAFIVFFNDVFDALFRLCADSEPNVQNAAQFLDNLIKDIVTASPTFDIDAFIPRLKEYLTVVNPYKRQFLINWITVLASVPDIDMLVYLPELLGGLMTMLSDSNREIRQSAGKALQEFLIEIQSSRNADYGSLAEILVSCASSADEGTRLTAIRWLKEFVVVAKEQLLPHYAAILGAVLPCISHPNHDICMMARQANNELLHLPDGQYGIDTKAILAVISSELGSEQEPTRLEALHWVNSLLSRSRPEVLDQLSVLLPALFDALSAPSDRVVLEALSVQASIAGDQAHFLRLVKQLMDRFRGPAGARLLQRRGSLIVRRLAALLGGQQVFRALAGILEAEADIKFASAMVQALNLILLTAPEVKEFRGLLAQAGSDPQGGELFTALYRSWSHSAGALLSLCFLAQAYSHASDLIHVFATLPMGVEVLVQIDRLVQLLETPIFTYLRLQLLQPARYPALVRSMYGLLMLLPQSDAFKTLHARLHSVPTMAMLKLDGSFNAGDDADLQHTPSNGATTPRDFGKDCLDFAPLLQLFHERQELQAADEEKRRGTEADEQAPQPFLRPMVNWDLPDVNTPSLTSQPPRRGSSGSFAQRLTF